ncbi:MAG: CdaR family protein [Patescibacteria group bacterium]
MQFGVGSNDTIWYTAVDFILLAVVAYGILQFLNSEKGLRYLGITAIGLVGLTVSAFWRLPGLHAVFQLGLVALIVSFPIIFHERWTQLLSGAPNNIPAYLPRYGLVLGALTLAAVAVFLGSGGLVKISEVPSEITVKAINLPEGMTANFGSGKNVRVIVSAPRDIWSELSEKSFSATVDVAGRAEGTYDLPITVVSQLESVKIISTKPEKVVVTIEPVIKKTVPVALRTSGSAGDQLIPGEPVFTPDKVEIAGPKTVINDISQVYAQIKLNGETETIELAVALVALNASGEVISSVEAVPAQTNVKLPLVKAGASKTVGIRPVLTGSPAAGYWISGISLDPAIITVQGSADVLTALKDVPTAGISVANLTQDSSQTITLDFPAGVTPAGTITTVKITIKLSKTDTTKAISPEIVYVGLDPALKVASIIPASISAVISAAAEVMAGISGSQVKLNLNLAAYKSAGTYSVSISNAAFELPSGVSLSSFLPSAIDVTLENK